MEFKVIVYIIVGIIYFIVSMKKKADEQKAKAPKTQPEIKPSTRNPIEQILEEIKKQQAAEAAKKLQSKPVAKTTTSKSTPLVKKVGKSTVGTIAAFEEGRSNFESAYQRPLTDEEKVERGTLKVANEGIYKIETIEEAEARAEQEATAYQLNAREAVIGSIILERKF